MLNKPRGLICACKDERQGTVMSCFPEDIREGLFHVGRLDKDTEGMLIVTDDGKLCQELLLPENNVPKTYLFIAMGTLNEEEIGRLEEGLCIYSDSPEQRTMPAKLEIISTQPLSEVREYLNAKDSKKPSRRDLMPTTTGKITITEGKKHQVRRMLKAVGCYIVYLKRLSIGRLSLDEGLATGEYREISGEELLKLKEK